MNHQSLSALIWAVADLLRGDYRQSEYGKVILPFTVLRRLDCVLEATKEAVLAEQADKQKLGINPEPFLLRKAGQSFCNTSPLDMKKLMGDQDHIKENLFSYIQGFSAAVRDIFERFDFYTQIDRLAKAGLLYQVTEKFANVDVHPDKVSNSQMGLVFEELIRKFAEISNETAGEHFTPREVIRLMVNLLFIEDDDVLAKPGVVRTIYDPTAGTGGMLLSLVTQQAVTSIILAMTRRDVGKPAFSLRNKRFVKTHALSLLGTTRLLSRSVRKDKVIGNVNLAMINSFLASLLTGKKNGMRLVLVLGMERLISQKSVD